MIQGNIETTGDCTTSGDKSVERLGKESRSTRAKIKRKLVSIWKVLREKRSEGKNLRGQPKDALPIGKGGMTGIIPWIVRRVSRKLKKQQQGNTSPAVTGGIEATSNAVS